MELVSQFVDGFLLRQSPLVLLSGAIVVGYVMIVWLPRLLIATIAGAVVGALFGVGLTMLSGYAELPGVIPMAAAGGGIVGLVLLR
ncbi:MAG: hypothetical protein HYY04_14700 [Chloroflexi bacterium]|nr:hypothetical protein [Chloroflexota bacterium]